MLLQQDAALAGTRVVLALMLVVLASSLALGICFGLMRRIQAISPPKDVATDADQETANKHE